jgi:hypothetical protein
MNAGTRAAGAYDEMKRLVTSGLIAPAERLDPVRLAKTLATGITPIREALFRLAGERLVDLRMNAGFHLPVMTETMLIDLYRWNLAVLRIAMGPPGWKRTQAADPGTLSVEGDRADTLLLAIAQRTGNPELVAQVRSANDRLAVARIAETMALPDSVAETKLLIKAANTQSTVLPSNLTQYHRARISKAREIVAYIYRLPEIISA